MSVIGVVVAHPALEGDPEDRDRHLTGECRLRVGDAPPAQRVGERGGQRRQLDQLTFAELLAAQDDGLALPGELAAVVEERTGRRERGAHGRRTATRSRRLDHGVHQQRLEQSRAREEDLALVGEVPEERALGHTRPLGDLGHGRPVEPAVPVAARRPPASSRPLLSGSHRAMAAW